MMLCCDDEEIARSLYGVLSKLYASNICPLLRVFISLSNIFCNTVPSLVPIRKDVNIVIKLLEKVNQNI